jgi:hypothetical protein
MAERRSGLIINIGSVAGEMWVIWIPLRLTVEAFWSSTPWSGLYSASKAALHSLTETLQMECRPFNINVMLVSPGSVKSNLVNNQTPIFKLPPNSLYMSYLPNIMGRLRYSQQNRPMPTDKFAQMVVSKALQKNPPFYFTLGGNATLLTLCKWFPRTWVMSLMWWLFSRPKSTWPSASSLPRIDYYISEIIIGLRYLVSVYVWTRAFLNGTSLALICCFWQEVVIWLRLSMCYCTCLSIAKHSCAPWLKRTWVLNDALVWKGNTCWWYS